MGQTNKEKVFHLIVNHQQTKGKIKTQTNKQRHEIQTNFLIENVLR